MFCVELGGVHVLVKAQPLRGIQRTRSSEQANQHDLVEQMVAPQLCLCSMEVASSDAGISFATGGSVTPVMNSFGDDSSRWRPRRR